MNLPIRALYEIRGFSKPMTRVDWRTCKRNEIRIIKVQISLSKLGQKMWPALERKLRSDEADRVIRLLTAYADAEAAAQEAAKQNLAAEYHAACVEWRKHASRFGRCLQVKS
jgi:vacuolar-type H+-ATPase subunit B/Vma2